jgi:hypothetical protein
MVALVVGKWIALVAKRLTISTIVMRSLRSNSRRICLGIISPICTRTFYIRLLATLLGNRRIRKRSTGVFFTFAMFYTQANKKPEQNLTPLAKLFEEMIGFLIGRLNISILLGFLSAVPQKARTAQFFGLFSVKPSQKKSI